MKQMLQNDGVKRFLAALAIVIIFALGFLARDALFKVKYRNAQPMLEAFQCIDFRYYKQLSPEKMKELNYEAIEAMVKQLDKYSRFSRPQKTGKYIQITPDRKIKFITPPNITKPIEKKIIDNIGYLKIKIFLGDKIYQQVKQSVECFNKAKVQGLIIDLRDNPGGSTETVFKISDLFLEKGKVIIVKVQRLGPLPLETEYKAKKEIEFQKPIVILVNRGSASASEIFASALQCNKKATIVGSQTFGKGVGQGLFLFKDDSILTLTTTKTLTANYQDLHGKGITPDIVIKDPGLQLQKAIEILKNSSK